MRVSFACKTESDADSVYELLTNTLCGCSVLSGSKQCTNYYPELPDVWEFDLTKEEMEAVLKLPEVTYGGPAGLGKLVPMSYIKVGQRGIPKLASYTSTFNNGNDITSCIPHSLLYCQDVNLKFTQDSLTNGDVVSSLSSIDCSNLDILIIDSGVDGTHDDFKDEQGNSRVINFDWTLLRESFDPVNGDQIITSLPANWTSDFNGHGTACASLVAGNRCGFAKNAKIYFLKVNGLDPNNGGLTSIETALKLAISFHVSKKEGLYGLDPSRPTICSNSWGYQGPSSLYAIDNSEDNKNFSSVFQNGKRVFGTAVSDPMNYFNAAVDGYFRQMLNEGMHVLRAAGNNNNYLKNEYTGEGDDLVYGVTEMPLHFFTGVNDSQWYAIPLTYDNYQSYTPNNIYNGFRYGYGGVSYMVVPVSYSSPNLGFNSQAYGLYTRERLPLIIVGDITPIGTNDADSNIFWTAGNAKAAFNVLSANTIQGYIKNTSATRYTSLSGPFFIKTSYSNFGPDVDIYAPGNGAWAALTNQANFNVNSPNFTITPTGKYYFFNGTSSACPIVAGILGTYLAVFPNKTNREARTWLITNAVSGNIMETQKNTLTVETIPYTFELPFGSDYNLMNNRGYLRLVQANNGNFLKANIYDVAFNNRFFDTNNLIAQAYPLRRAVLRSEAVSLSTRDTTLKRQGPTSLRISHALLNNEPVQ
jgi:hypothetical protein